MEESSHFHESSDSSLGAAARDHEKDQGEMMQTSNRMESLAGEPEQVGYNSAVHKQGEQILEEDEQCANKNDPNKDQHPNLNLQQPSMDQHQELPQKQQQLHNEQEEIKVLYQQHKQLGDSEQLSFHPEYQHYYQPMEKDQTPLRNSEEYDTAEITQRLMLLQEQYEHFQYMQAKSAEHPRSLEAQRKTDNSNASFEQHHSKDNDSYKSVQLVPGSSDQQDNESATGSENNKADVEINSEDKSYAVNECLTRDTQNSLKEEETGEFTGITENFGGNTRSSSFFNQSVRYSLVLTCEEVEAVDSERSHHYIPIERSSYTQGCTKTNVSYAETEKTQTHCPWGTNVNENVSFTKTKPRTKGKKSLANSSIHFKCLCVNDFLNKRKPEKYACGLCYKRFTTLCHLHVHIEKHGSGGSYHFDHVNCTAYPKYDTFCSFTQTEPDLFARPEEAILKEGNIKDVDSPKKEDIHLAVQVESEEKKKSVETDESSSQSMSKSRKRKQANPKPSKARIEKLVKIEGNKKVKKKDNILIKQHQKENPEVGKYYAEENITGKVNYKVCAQGENHENEKNFENAFVEVKQEIIVFDEMADNELPRKRGRPKKSPNSLKSTYKKKRKLSKKTRKILKKDLVDGMDELDNFMGDDEFGTVGAKSKKIRKNATKYQICDTCGITVPSYNYLYHVRQHTGEKPFVCEQCGKAFAHRRFLTKHFLTHSDDKPWKCELCTAQFCQKNEYEMHMNGHKGNRPYECKVCDMRFFSKSMLNTHQANIHMGITRFECEVCNRRFFKRSSLNVHQATHFDATLKCSFCDRKFKDKTGLKRHERIHTGEKRFRCHICEHAFIQSTPYWVHMEKRHFMDRETVKKLLNEIRENNKRSGIQTKINELPADINPEVLTPEKDTDMPDVTIQSRKISSVKSHRKSKLPHNHSAGSNVSGHKENEPARKVYADIKVPTLYPTESMDTPVTNTFSHASETTRQQLHFQLQELESRQHQDATNIVSSDNPQQHAVTTNSNLLVSCLTSTGGFNHYGLPLSLVQQHGFIGLNNLQQALDYSSSVPDSGTYTDISRERVNQHH